MKYHRSLLPRTMIVLGLTSLEALAQSTYEPYTFTTLAGGGGFRTADGTGSAERFWAPSGVAVDTNGNVYVGDQFNDVIRKVTPAGVVTTLAGLAGSSGSADGTGSAARFDDPWGMAVDGVGSIYVADPGNSTIRKVTPAGVVTTLAGLAYRTGSADGTGSEARFDFGNGGSGMAVDSAGNVYVADQRNDTIRKVTPVGVVTTLAGLAGISGSANGMGRDARFNGPTGVALDSAGNLYVADSGNDTIRKVTQAGVVTTLATGFNSPTDVAVDSAGNVYVADAGNYTIRKVTPAGAVTTLAGGTGTPGNADGTGSAARFAVLNGVAVDSAGDLYVADLGNNTIRMVTTAGVVTTLAGLGGLYGSADETGSVARFRGPASVALDTNGNVYVADQVNHTIRKVTPAGVVTTLAGLAGRVGSANGAGSAARFNSPTGVAADSAGNLYVADCFNLTIRRVTPSGVVTTLAGLAGAFGSDDGKGSAARFSFPTGVAVDTNGNVYVADAGNSTIRKVTPAGVVTTLAGLASADPGSADGTGSTARFKTPYGVAVDNAGNIYVADAGNYTIRKVTPAGAVTTLAGLADNAGSADGLGSSARFYDPQGVAVDSAGNVYVADTFNNTVRKVTPAGAVTTLGGGAGIYGNADGTGSAVRFNSPNGVAVDSAGNVYVADFYLSTIRKGSPALAISSSGTHFGFNGGQFGFDLSGPAGPPVVVEASADLVSWLPIWTNTLGPAVFTDPQVTNSPQKFYRAMTKLP